MIILFWACTTQENTSESPTYPRNAIVISSVAFDYSVGALAHFDLETHTLTENIASVSGDPVVVYDEGSIWQLNRYQHDTLRKYTPEELHVPQKEISVAATIGSSNPHDVEVCAGNLFVSLYGLSNLSIRDPQTLEETSSLDLRSYADEDGIPEMSSLVEWEGTLFVGLQRLNRNNGFEARTSTILQIDCSTHSILREWNVGSNITLFHNEDTVYAITQQDENSSAGILSYTENEWIPIFETEETISYAGIQDNRLVYVSLAADMSAYQFHCVDLETTETVSSEPIREFITDLWVQNEQTAWFGTHWGWMNPSNTQPGLWTLDTHTCSPIEQWKMEFAPFSMAFVPESTE